MGTQTPSKVGNYIPSPSTTNTSTLRVCTRLALAMVEATATMVDIVLFGPCLFSLLFSGKPSILEKPSAPYHGVLFLLCIRSQSLCQSGFAWSDGYRFGSGCVCDWFAWEHIFPCCGRNCLHVYGDRCSVSCSCQSLRFCLINLTRIITTHLRFFSLASRRAAGSRRPTTTSSNNIQVAFLWRHV